MNYPSIRIEGAILSPDILESLHDDIVGQRPADFGLEANVKVKDEIARAWADAQDYWRIFKRKSASGERRVAGGEYQAARFSPLTTETRNLWMAPLLGLLGYQLEYQAKAAELNGKTYAISHRVVNRANTPVHIVGYNDPAGLDSRAGGNQPTGARPTDSPFAAPRSPKMSAHGLVQEYLNLHDELFGLVTNGRVLRLLRDSSRLIKLTYLEFDLDRIFTDGLFADFAVLYRLLHASRLPASSEWRTASSEEKDRSPLATRHSLEACWLERYHQDSIEQGSRIREGLRAAVTEALGILGTGFLNHPDNVELNSQVWSGQLRPEAYFNHLLRLIYRLLFVMVIEERGLVFPVGASFRFVQLYFTHYSVQRLRKLAVTRGLKIQRYYDAWLSLLSTFQLFERPEQAEKIGMTALGGQLFHPESLGPLAACHLSNADLLGALERLCYFDDPKTGQRTPVNFGALATEEFGSVYESLLELHPVIEASGEWRVASGKNGSASDLLATDYFPSTVRFFFKQAAGNERKTSGSYYTPTSLVDCLLDSALDPVLEERVASSERQAVNGEWQIVSSEWKGYFRRGIYGILSRPSNMAASHESGRIRLFIDEILSKRGAVRLDQPNPPGSQFHSGEHRRGLGAAFNERISAIPANRERQSAGTGNPSFTQSKSVDLFAGDNTAAYERSGDFGQADASLVPIPITEYQLEQLWSLLPLATRRLLLADQAVLALKVCDPACGSGHFLIAAAQRIARRLAFLRAGDEEPSPDMMRHALREVISHCIYGVDINPMSVELCKLGLWLEAVEPGKPLTFLDHHIKCGNSLLGATPEAIKEGIPDEAYKPIEGDTKEAANWMKKLNREAKAGGQRDLFELLESDLWDRLGNLPAAFAQLETLEDDTPEALEAKEKRYREIIEDSGYDNARLLHDAWCAAFVWPKAKIEPGTDLTTRHLRDIEANPHNISPWRKQMIRELARQYQFFHWHLEFPGVFGVGTSGEQGAAGAASGKWRVASGLDTPSFRQGSPESRHREVKLPANTGLQSNTDETGKLPSMALDSGIHAGMTSQHFNLTVLPLPARHSPFSGFDCIFGNPPWERVKLQEKEFFAERSPDIANSPNAATRQRLINQLVHDNPALLDEFHAAQRQAEGESRLLRDSGLYPLCGRGDINLYAIFAELGRLRISDNGRMGMVLPSGIATDDTTKFYFQNVVENESLVSLFDFENKGIFQGVHNSYKFCLFTAGSGRSLPAGRKPGDAAEFVFFAHSVDDLNDPESRFELSAEDIALLNPNTRTCPIFRSRRDAELNKLIYRRTPALGEVESSSGKYWNVKVPQGLFHQTNDAGLLYEEEKLTNEGFVRGIDGNWLRGAEKFGAMYEGRMIHIFNHRASSVTISDTNTFRSGVAVEVTDTNLANPNFVATPRYWVSISETEARIPEAYTYKWFPGFKDVTSATNERTMIAAIIPRTAVVYSIRVIFSFGYKPAEIAALFSSLNSYCFDYIVRSKTSGNHITDYIFRQLPVLPPETYTKPCLWMASLENTTPFATRYSPFAAFILPRVLELTFTAWDLEAFARDCLGDFQKLSPPFEKGGQGGFNAGAIAMDGKESPLTPLLQKVEPENGFAAYWRLYSPHSPLATDRSPLTARR